MTITSPVATLAPLSAAERGQLASHEQTIAAGLQTFYAVGAALMAIRESRLYRESYQSFDLYCRDRWGMARQHAYRLIDSATVIANLSPIGDSLPATESQARPLASLPPEQQRAAWRAAVASAPAGRVTAEHVKRAAAAQRPATCPRCGQETRTLYGNDHKSAVCGDCRQAARRAAPIEPEWSEPIAEEPAEAPASAPPAWLLQLLQLAECDRFVFDQLPAAIELLDSDGYASAAALLAAIARLAPVKR